MADVFPVAPLTLGEATTLVCRVENIFPPDVEVTWQLGGVPVTRGVTHTHYTPTGDLAFTRFSYLRVTPAAGDVVTCIVTRQEDNSTTVAFWGERGVGGHWGGHTHPRRGLVVMPPHALCVCPPGSGTVPRGHRGAGDGAVRRRRGAGRAAGAAGCHHDGGDVAPGQG